MGNRSPAACSRTAIASPSAAPDERLREIERRERELEDQSAQLLRERTEWRQRKADIEQECQRQQSAAVEIQQRLRRQERELAEARIEFERRRRETGGEEKPASKPIQDVVGVRRELGEIKQQLVEKFQQR